MASRRERRPKGGGFERRATQGLRTSRTALGNAQPEGLHYFQNPTTNNSQPAVGSFPGFIGGGTSSINNAAQAVLSDIHIFTPALVNEFRFGYVRHNGSIFGTGQDGVGFAHEHNVAMFPAPQLRFPSFSFIYSGQQSGSAEFSGWGGGDPNLNVENRFQTADNLSWTHGKHAL